MGWQATNAAAIAGAVRVALATEFPAATERSHDARPVPEALVPAYAVTVEPEEATPASMGAADRLVTGAIRVAFWIMAPHDSDRLELMTLADHVRATLASNAALDQYLGAFDPTTAETEITAEAERIARLDLTFSAEWMEAATTTPSILARFGLA